jgi:hypothetical protein
MTAAAMNRLRLLVPIDVSPIKHIILERDEMKETPFNGLFPPWYDFMFQVPISLAIKSVDEGGADVAVRALLCVIVSVLNKFCSMEDGKPIEPGEKRGWRYMAYGIISYPEAIALAVELVAEWEVGPDGRYSLFEDEDHHPEPAWDDLGDFKLPSGETPMIFASIPNWAKEYPDVGKQLRYQAGLLMTYVCSFVNFMQCKNIGTQKVHYPDYKPKRKKQRHPVYKYHELTIVKPGVRAAEGLPLGGGSTGKPLHQVRGHPMHFTKDKPMFGNPRLYGTFWCPPHARGNLKYGKIKKTYQVTERKEIQHA